MVIAVRTVLVAIGGRGGGVISFRFFLSSLPCFATVTYLSSHSLVSLRKHFLHFLHANTISMRCASRCVSDSAWHSAQSNHFWQQGERMETWALRTCLLCGVSRVAGVEDGGGGVVEG